MSDTQQIKDKIDIVDLINEYVQMKPAGINHKGLCPFHHEKTPSFMASRERQSFHCFGCGKGGDVFTFVQEIEGMEFVEALKYLANKAGIQLTNTFESSRQSSQKQRIKDINAEAARFYHSFLTKMDASKSARDYLEGRGLTQETIEVWQIGFIPDQWDLLTQYLLKKGHSIDDLVASGMTIKRDGASVQSGKGFYDRFRGRIMFPIRDVHGSVVGFTGRVLVETKKSGGKYVNTPQTPVYDKSSVIFGLDKAKQEIRKQNFIVLVEGQLDVISVYQAGMQHVVAASGTALTEQHVKLLSRYSKNIAMAFDSDVAGVKAAKRGIEVAIREGMNVRVIHIPDDAGNDPDECVKKHTDVWFQAVEHAESVMEWYFSMAFQDRDITDPKQKQEIANELLPEIANIPFAIERDHWLQELSVRLRVDVSVLRDDLERVSRQGNRPKPEPEKKEQESVRKKSTLTRLDLLLERLIMLYLRFPKYKPEEIFGSAYAQDLPSVYIPLYRQLVEGYTEDRIDIDSLRRSVHEDNSENNIDILLMKGELEFSDMREDAAGIELSKLSKRVREESIKGRKEHLQQEIEQAEKAGNAVRLEALLKTFQELS